MSKEVLQLTQFIITPVKEKKGEKSPDYNIQTRDFDGNVIFIGSAWKKTNQYGTYLSCTMKNPGEYNGQYRPGYAVVAIGMEPKQRTYQPEDFPIATEPDPFYDPTVPPAPGFPDVTPS